MLTPGHRLRPVRDEIAAKVIEGEAIIMNLTDKVYYDLEKVGGFAWELIEAGLTLGEIVEAIASRYDVSPEQARKDMDLLVEALLREKLVTALPPWENPDLDQEQKEPYEAPQLNVYRDMGDLLALDPPTPWFQDPPWKDPDDESSA